MSSEFKNKCAVITGGSRGMGAEVARQLRASGCKVAVLARTVDHGVGDLNIACDVADDIADAVLKLFTMRWVTGQILPVDGGLSLQTPTDPTEFF